MWGRAPTDPLPAPPTATGELDMIAVGLLLDVLRAARTLARELRADWRDVGKQCRRG